MTLQVIVAPDGDGWVAQGLEVDYAAGGASVSETKEHFMTGLRAAAEARLERTGTLAQLNQPARPKTWLPLMTCSAGTRLNIERTAMDLQIVGFLYDTVAYIVLAPELPTQAGIVH